jgi:hypothetical protein
LELMIFLPLPPRCWDCWPRASFPLLVFPILASWRLKELIEGLGRVFWSSVYFAEVFWVCSNQKRERKKKDYYCSIFAVWTQDLLCKSFSAF